MINIRPYYSKDYLKVLPFLKRFNSQIEDSFWKKLLEYEWENKTNSRGMLLENENEIVGFISYIISSRVSMGLDFTFCNISTWVVDEKFRSKSLQLLAPLFEIKNCNILNLSPHENTFAVFKALRFDVISEYEYNINPFKVRMASLFVNGSVSSRIEKINHQNLNDKNLDVQTKKYIEDHRFYENVHFYKVYITKNSVENELVLAFNQKELEPDGSVVNLLKELPYKLLGRTSLWELLYTDSADILVENISEILSSLTRNTNARSINISDYFLHRENFKLKFVNKNKKQKPWFFYSNSGVETSEISLLYSEKVLLNF